MPSLVIWLDRKKALLFHVSPAGLRREVQRFHGKEHPRETQGRNHELWESDAYRFYRGLADSLAHSADSKWLLFGPSQARLHFQRFIEEHRPELKNRIIGNQAAPPESEGKTLERARRFFRRFALFGTQAADTK